MGLKRLKDDEEKIDKFVKTHVSRLLKMDMIAVLLEFERQEEVNLALKVFLYSNFVHAHIYNWFVILQNIHA